MKETRGTPKVLLNRVDDHTLTEVKSSDVKNNLCGAEGIKNSVLGKQGLRRS